MNPDRTTAESLLAEAIEISDQRQREQFLAERCGPDSALLNDVGQMVDDYFAAGNLLQAPAMGVAGQESAMEIYDSLTQIGNYRLREKIGEGGMGVVFVADQTAPIKRRVALKLIKPGMDSKQVIARFEAERQALALMEHPNIAKILDGGTTELGHPFFVMELVRGVRITKFCYQRELSQQEILRLFTKLCSAVEHAHQKGILHRDLKPGNILVTMHDDEAVVKVIDFGVAKTLAQPLTDRSVYTGFLQLVGTPIYMSPEQLEMNDLGVDTRSDVYSLGVVLYEMLTGLLPFDRRAFDSGNLDEMRRLVCETVPPKPSERVNTVKAEQDTTQPSGRRLDRRGISAELSGELDWIVMKAVEKDRTRRYQSAREFAQDVQRYLNGEPVLACPPSMIYHARKFAHKNRLALLAAAAILLSLVVGNGMALWQSSVATAEAERAGQAEVAAKAALGEAHRQTALANESAQRAELATIREAELRSIAERALYVKDLRHLQRQISEGRHQDAMPMLITHVHRDDESDLRRWDWYYLMSLANQSEKEWIAHDEAGYAVACHPDKNWVASAGADATVKIWNGDTGELLHTIVEGYRTRTSVDWDHSGARLVFATQSAPALVRIWNASTNQVTRVFEYDRSFWTVRFSNDGERLVAGGIRTSDAAKTPGENLMLFRKEHGTWSLAEKHLLENVNITSAEWSHDDRLLSVATPGANLRLFRSEGDSLTNEQIDGLSEQPYVTHWHPEKRLLAIGNQSGTCMLLDTRDQSVQMLPWTHVGQVQQICWSPDGLHIASCGVDGKVFVFDVGKATVTGEFMAHHGTVRGIAWFAGSHRLVSVGEDGFLRIWSREACFPNTTRHLGVFAKKADLTTLQTVDADEQKAFWDSRIAQVIEQRPVASSSNTLTTNDSTTKDESRNVQLRMINEHAALRFTENAAKRSIEVFNRNAVMQPVIRTDEFIDDVRALTQDAEYKLGRGLHFVRHPNRELYAAAFRGLGQVRLFDLANGKADALETSPSQWVIDLEWSPDGKQLAVLSWGHLGTEEVHYLPYVHLYDLDRRKLLGSYLCGKGTVEFAWHPDGKRFLLGSDLGLVNLCEFEQPGVRVIRSWKVHDEIVNALCLHPDGKLIASAANNQISLWDSMAGEVTITFSYPHWMQSLEFSADGHQLTGVTSEGDLMVWDAGSGYRYAESNEMEARVLREWEGRFMQMLAERNLASSLDWANDIERLDTYASWNSLRHIALLHHVTGDDARYRKNCAVMVNRGLQLKNPTAQQLIAWTCAIAPDGVNDFGSAVALARKPLSAGLNEYQEFNLTLGAILVRAGQYEEARQTLENVRTDKLTTMSPAYRDYFLAMACHGLGDNTTALEYLNSALKQTERDLANSPSWVREQTLRLLRTECGGMSLTKLRAN